MTIDLSALVTESVNPASEKLDTLSGLEIATLINQEDKKVALAVEQVLPQVGQAIEAIHHAFQRGGRLFYSGAGTSGRLGVLDASECPPTFGTSPQQVVALIAGGEKAISQAVENAEDNAQQGIKDLQAYQFSAQDVLVGIAASGRTPYVMGTMQYARDLGAYVVALTCHPGSEMGQLAHVAIEPLVGAEVITGSSRMKAGTAQKMVLNMLTTASMVLSGKVYGNLMVDVVATNAKLVQRQIRIVMQATECDRATAERALAESGRHCKTAIVMILTGSNAEQAASALQAHQGKIRAVLTAHTAIDN